MNETNIHENAPLLTVDEVARRLSVPKSWVYANAEAGTLPSLKVGRYRRFRAAELEQYLQARREGPRS
jgi:excisionase family DNA binding protein